METRVFFLSLAKGIIKDKVKSAFLYLNIGQTKWADFSKRAYLVMETLLSELYRRGKNLTK